MTLSVNPRRVTRSYQPITHHAGSRSAQENQRALKSMSESQLGTGLTVEQLVEQQARLKAEFLTR